MGIHENPWKKAETAIKPKIWQVALRKGRGSKQALRRTWNVLNGSKKLRMPSETTCACWSTDTLAYAGSYFIPYLIGKTLKGGQARTTKASRATRSDTAQIPSCTFIATFFPWISTSIKCISLSIMFLPCDNSCPSTFSAFQETHFLYCSTSVYTFPLLFIMSILFEFNLDIRHTGFRERTKCLGKKIRNQQPVSWTSVIRKVDLGFLLKSDKLTWVNNRNPKA